MSNMIHLLVFTSFAALAIAVPSPALAQVDRADPDIIVLDDVTHPVEMTSPDPDNPIIDKDDETGEFHFEGDVGRPGFGTKPDRVTITITYPDRPSFPDRFEFPVDGDGHFEGDKNLFGDGNGTISIQPYRGSNRLGDPTEFDVVVR